MEKYFTKKEAIETIIEGLDWYSGYYGDLHNELFNTDYYIIGTHEADRALKEYGIYEAIGKIQEYEKSIFGEIYTDFSDPEKVANMLWYIIGEEVIYDIIDSYYMDRVADDETNEELIEGLQEELDEL